MTKTGLEDVDTTLLNSPTIVGRAYKAHDHSIHGIEHSSSIEVYDWVVNLMYFSNILCIGIKKLHSYLITES